MLTQTLDRPVMLPPGVPAERVKQMRDAFDATMADPAFRAEIERRNLHVDPVRGEEMTKAFERAFASAGGDHRRRARDDGRQVGRARRCG